MKEFFIKLLKKCLYTIIIVSNIKKGNALEKGEILFKTNCSVCHLGGNNIIIPEKNLKGKTFLIAGAAGFVPGHISEFYLNLGAKVIGLDNFITGTQETIKILSQYENFVFHECDVSNTS